MAMRRMVLERAGHTVTEARDLRAVSEACRNISVSVAILGQSLPQKEKLRIGDVIRSECPRTKILELHIGMSPDVLSADANLQVVAGAVPESLVECVAALASSRKRQRA